MYRVLKYRLLVSDKQVLTLPAGSKVISAVVQQEQIVAYAIVPVKTLEPHMVQEHTFIIVGTGNPTEEPLFLYELLGTLSLYNGQLMFHVFHGWREVPRTENTVVSLE